MVINANPSRTEALLTLNLPSYSTNEGLNDRFINSPPKPIFVAASHQTVLDTRLMTRRSIKVGIREEECQARAEARALLTMMHLAHLKVAQPNLGALRPQVCFCWTGLAGASRHTEHFKQLEVIGFTLLYFKMSVISLVPKTKMVDVGKLISLGNLLVRKVTWFVLTTTSPTLILSRAFGADRMSRIAYICSRLPRTNSLTFWLPETTPSLILSILTYRDNTLSLSLSHFNFQRQHSFSLHFRLPETVWPCHLVIQFNTRYMGAYTFCKFFLSCSAFSVWLIPASNTASEISSNPERDKQPIWEKTRFS